MKLSPKHISQLGRVITGKTPPTGRQEFFGGEFLFVTPSDLQYDHYYCRSTERTVTQEAKSILPNQFIPADAVMFTCIGATIGKCGIAPSECLTNQQINSVVANEHTGSKFLYYLLCHNVDVIKGLGGGAATPIVNKSKFEEVELLVPSFRDQQAERRPLESLCVADGGIQTGPFGSQLHQADYSEEGIPVIMPKDLVGYRIAVESIARIPEDLANKLGRHRMTEGDTVYGRRGDIGRRAFIGRRQEGWFCGTGCLRIRPDLTAINPRFLFDALGSSETAGAIANRAKGATMPNLNAMLMRSVPVLVAPRRLQDYYAEQVSPRGCPSSC
jgi:restriction endonuclease S subunit